MDIYSFLEANPLESEVEGIDEEIILASSENSNTGKAEGDQDSCLLLAENGGKAEPDECIGNVDELVQLSDSENMRAEDFEEPIALDDGGNADPDEGIGNDDELVQLSNSENMHAEDFEEPLDDGGYQSDDSLDLWIDYEDWKLKEKVGYYGGDLLEQYDRLVQAADPIVHEILELVDKMVELLPAVDRISNEYLVSADKCSSQYPEEVERLYSESREFNLLSVALQQTAAAFYEWLHPEAQVEPEAQGHVVAGQIQMEFEAQGHVVAGQIQNEPEAQGHAVAGQIQMEPEAQDHVVAGQIQMEPETQGNVVAGQIQMEHEAQGHVVAGQMDLDVDDWWPDNVKATPPRSDHQQLMLVAEDEIVPDSWEDLE